MISPQDGLKEGMCFWSLGHMEGKLPYCNHRGPRALPTLAGPSLEISQLFVRPFSPTCSSLPSHHSSCARRQ